jgi:ABC-2 type transport system permease protein
VRDIGPHLHAARAIVRRDLQVALSYRAPFFASILSAFFSLTLFYYLSRLVRVNVFESADAYYAFAVVGLVILQVLNSTLQTPPATMRQEMVAGTFERIVVSPYGPVATIVSMMIYPFIYALVMAMIMVGFAGIVFGVDVEWATLPLAVPTAILGTAAFAPFGMLILAVVLISKQAMAGTTWIVAGIALVAGLYFPTSLLPDWIEWTSDVQPFSPAVELLRNVIVGTPLQDSAWFDVVKLVGFAIVLLPPAVFCVDRAVRFSRNKGTLTEY